MAGHSPHFSLTLGSLRSDTDSPAGGPSYFAVDRSLELPADGLRVVLAERGEVVPGDVAELELGDEDGLERVFTGTVVEVRPHAAGVEVFAAGTVLALLELRASSYYQEQTAGDIARDLIGKAGLDAGDISDGVSLPRFAVERRRSAWPQLKRLAERLGFDVFSDREGKIHFRGLGEAANLGSGGLVGAAAGAAGAVSALAGGGGALAFGKHLIATVGSSRPALERKVVVGGESPMSGQGEDKSFWLTAKDTDFEDSAGDGEETLVLDPVARTKDLAGRFAAGYLTGLRRTRREQRVTLLGQAALDLGAPLETVDAPEALLNAKGFVKALRHRFGGGIGFLTEATLCVEGDE
ncbi:hypothetical protein [Pyxidicoccus caerfyrddinensis]|uniref:hypothetical protein n=1 Tax=Pyxidicoccus caerfyrddinensis TaxID=2709663 RepID=UPI0013DACD4B|nr:hypothetical protein [Pyxidicoccus caerfyrddinensis]